MKIYTKTGDQGKTRLVGGSLVPKNDLRIDTYGSVDELNSVLGVAIAFLQQSPATGTEIRAQLQRIQNELFNLGSLLACENPSLFAKLPAITDAHVQNLEQAIDQLTKDLPELRQFILPGGTLAASQLHVARTVCRRCERLATSLISHVTDSAATENPPELSTALIYLNRLSDYFFTTARWINWKSNVADIPWSKG